MKNIFWIGGLAIVGWLLWEYFRKPEPLTLHMQSETELQNLGMEVNTVTAAAVPVNASIGIKPLTTLELNPILGRSIAIQISPIEQNMKLGDTLT